MNITAAILADAAIVAEGKLYVHGGGWDRINAPTLPHSQNLALVLVFRTEWQEANQDINFVIELIDEDHQPAGIRGEGTLRTGHAATAEPGDPAISPLATTFTNLPFASEGLYSFRVTVGDRELASVPFRVAAAPQP